MKRQIKIKERRGFAKAALLLIILLCTLLFPFFENKTDGIPVSAASSGDVMTISRYDIDMTVNKNRKIEVREEIVMTPNKSGSQFRRSLPLEGDRYSDVSAVCVGQSGAECFVEEGDDYLDIVCELFTPRGTTRTYQIAYTMEIGKNDVKNGMRIDVVGFGWTVPLNDVTVTVHFPDSACVEQAVITQYGLDTPTGEFTENTLSADGKTLTLKADRLEKYRNSYGEYVSEGITLCFTLEAGVLDNFTKTQIFTEDMWKILLAGLACIALSVAVCVLTRTRRELITTVNISAPDGMDPMRMGKLLDGTVDNEDITSMIYYFAHKGYLSIDLSDEDDPLFKQLVDELPENARAHEKTLFNGLFQTDREVRVSQLKERFYKSVDMAKRQLLIPKMYEKRSIWGYVLGGIIGWILGLLTPLFMGRSIGGGYIYILGGFFCFPIALILLVGSTRKNYYYKWKKTGRIVTAGLQIFFAALFSAIFIFGFASHIMTKWEKLVLSICVFVCVFATSGALSRTEKYSETLGQILGFKEFITVTESDKIKFMLEQDPQLYYKVLPYAQVLGVTDEWEKKFKDILIEPPAWCTGTQFTVFDYIVLNRCLRRGMAVAMSRPEAKGGSYVGRSGGGGGFGGFGGGGHGGGGGSWR